MVPCQPFYSQPPCLTPPWCRFVLPGVPCHDHTVLPGVPCRDRPILPRVPCCDHMDSRAPCGDHFVLPRGPRSQLLLDMAISTVKLLFPSPKYQPGLGSPGPHLLPCHLPVPQLLFSCTPHVFSCLSRLPPPLHIHLSWLLTLDCRYAIALEIEAASVTSAIYVDGEDPCHSARVVEGGSPSGQDLLIVSGEEHDQGIKPEKYQDAYGRSGHSHICASLLARWHTKMLSCYQNLAFAQPLPGEVV